jgi:hypothetical protein
MAQKMTVRELAMSEQTFTSTALTDGSQLEVMAQCRTVRIIRTVK